jgi:hypothetical protein
MPDRDPNPQPDPLVARLLKNANETEDVVALVGFVGAQREGNLRLYPDRNLQRWLEIPATNVKDSIRIDTDDPLGGRTVIWVDRDSMTAKVFDDGALAALEEHFEGGVDGWMSTWQLIPDNRYVAAEMLDLLAPWESADYQEGAS